MSMKAELDSWQNERKTDSEHTRRGVEAGHTLAAVYYSEGWATTQKHPVSSGPDPSLPAPCCDLSPKMFPESQLRRKSCSMIVVGVQRKSSRTSACIKISKCAHYRSPTTEPACAPPLWIAARCGLRYQLAQPACPVEHLATPAGAPCGLCPRSHKSPQP